MTGNHDSRNTREDTFLKPGGWASGSNPTPATVINSSFDFIRLRPTVLSALSGQTPDAGRILTTVIAARPLSMRGWGSGVQSSNKVYKSGVH